MPSMKKPRAKAEPCLVASTCSIPYLFFSIYKYMCVLAQYDTYNIMPPLLHPVHREGNVFTGTYVHTSTNRHGFFALLYTHAELLGWPDHAIDWQTTRQAGRHPYIYWFNNLYEVTTAHEYDSAVGSLASLFLHQCMLIISNIFSLSPSLPIAQRQESRNKM